MNSLYTLGVRQTNSIQADLERLRTGDASASLLGLSCNSNPPPSHSPAHPSASPKFGTVRVVQETARSDMDMDMEGPLTAYCSAFLFAFG